jgi:hypothetical protein
MRCAVCYADCVVLLVLLVLPETSFYVTSARANPGSTLALLCLAWFKEHHITSSTLVLDLGFACCFGLLR